MGFDNSSLYHVESNIEGERRSLFDLATWKNGLAFRKIDFSQDGVPVIKIAELNNGIGSTTTYTQGNYDEDVFLQRGDLLFSWSGNPKTSIDIYRFDLPCGWLNQHIFKVTPNEDLVRKDFFYHLMKFLKPYFTEIAINKQTTGLGHVTIADLKRLNVICPSDKIQRKIAAILQSIDDKIYTNNAINKNLEEQAQAIYKAWFVDFEPWQGERPNSWEEGVLGDYVEIKRGGSPRPIQDYLVDSGLRWLKISDVTALQSPFIIDIKEHIKEDGLNKTVFLKAGALVLSNSATPGIPKILDVDSCIHDGWLYFPKSKLSNEFLYLLFKFIRKDLVQLGNGSVFTNLKTDILKNYPFSMPANNTLSMFDDIVTPLFQSMNNIARENKRLSNLRDALLPRLMSGEIDVSKIEV